jgi:hypothetical protein
MILERCVLVEKAPFLVKENYHNNGAIFRVRCSVNSEELDAYKNIYAKGQYHFSQCYIVTHGGSKDTITLKRWYKILKR